MFERRRIRRAVLSWFNSGLNGQGRPLAGLGRPSGTSGAPIHMPFFFEAAILSRMRSPPEDQPDSQRLRLIYDQFAVLDVMGAIMRSPNMYRSPRVEVLTNA
jgi:hypothetical protein